MAGRKFAVKQAARVALVVICLLAIVSAIVGQNTLALAADEKPIAVAVTSSSPPFAFLDAEGELRGFNVDLAHLLCKRLGKPCTIEALPFAKILSGLDDDTIQIGIANLLKTPDREKRILFSQPIWRSTTSFIGIPTLPVVRPDQVKDHFKICAIRKTRQSAYVEGLHGDPSHLVSLGNTKEVFECLQQGLCDLAIMPTMNALQLLNSEAGKGFDYYGQPLTQPGLSGNVHIGFSNQYPDLLTKVDAIIDQIRQDGTYQQLILRYFPFDIL